MDCPNITRTICARCGQRVGLIIVDDDHTALVELVPRINRRAWKRHRCPEVTPTPWPTADAPPAVPAEGPPPS